MVRCRGRVLDVECSADPSRNQYMFDEISHPEGDRLFFPGLFYCLPRGSWNHRGTRSGYGRDRDVVEGIPFPYLLTGL